MLNMEQFSILLCIVCLASGQVMVQIEPVPASIETHHLTQDLTQTIQPAPLKANISVMNLPLDIACPDGFEAMGDYCFYFYFTFGETSKTDQSGAAMYCANLDSTLPYPRSSWDLANWQAAVSDMVYNSGKGDPWMGATYNQSGNGDWTWPDLTPVPEQAWGAGQPANSNSMDWDWKCSTMISSSGELGDMLCFIGKGILCQAPATQVPQP